MNLKLEALTLLKQLFTKENFADAKLIDGTIVSAESFEPGFDLFILDENGQRIQAPEGEHTLEDGTKVVVVDGKIESIIKVEEAGKINKDENMEVEVEIEPYIEEVPEKEDEIAILKQAIDQLMEKVNVLEQEMGKYKMSSENTNTVFSNAIVEIAENLKQLPAGDKLEINPTEIESQFKKVSKKDKRDSLQEWLKNNKKS